MLFLSFEGLDGSGKTTQAERLQARLERDGYRTLLVREPGGTALSERIRTLLLDSSLRINPRAEMLLFSAARAQLVSEAIRPALASGTIVIADRFFDSTTAYQGGGRGIGNVDWMENFHRHVTGGLVPDCTFYFRIEPADAAARRRLREGAAPPDRMEQSDDTFFEKVAAAYDQLVRSEPDRIRVVDASQTIEQITDAVWKDVSRLLHQRRGTARTTAG